jgi:hypothetical protein
MSETLILKLPASIYADLQSLAESEQTEPSEMVARLVKAARCEHEAGPATRAFRRILERATDLGITERCASGSGGASRAAAC